LKVQKASRIGVVVSDHALRGAQRIDGKLVSGSIPLGGDFRKTLKQLLSSSPFIGKDLVVGLEGNDVLVESLVVPPGATKSAKAVCAERLKGDPIFNESNAALGVAVADSPSGSGPSMVIHAAVVHSRIAQVMTACRELQLQVHAVESAALAAWRAWTSDGLQVRLVRTETADIVQAGIDGRLLFCRIVERPISHLELRATISRAASLLSTDSFSQLTCSGTSEADLQAMARDLGIPVTAPGEAIQDAAAVGLATDGNILTEFTPPEERNIRAKRQLRRVRTYMASAAGALVLTTGLLGYQRIDNLEIKHVYLQERVQSHQEAELELAGLQAELVREQTNSAQMAGIRPGHKMSLLFSIIANSAPENLLLETIKIDDKIDADTSVPDGLVAAPRQLDAELHGLAGGDGEVRAFADALLDTGAFIDVRIEASQRVILANGEGGERFRIYATAETR
jgi:hypothetical protein